VAQALPPPPWFRRRPRPFRQREQMPPFLPFCPEARPIHNIKCSRDEILALAQDMLAKGRPLEDVIALLDYLAPTSRSLPLIWPGISDAPMMSAMCCCSRTGRLGSCGRRVSVEWAFQKSSQYNVPATLLFSMSCLSK